MKKFTDQKEQKFLNLDNLGRRRIKIYEKKRNNDIGKRKLYKKSA